MITIGMEEFSEIPVKFSLHKMTIITKMDKCPFCNINSVEWISKRFLLWRNNQIPKNKCFPTSNSHLKMTVNSLKIIFSGEHFTLFSWLIYSFAIKNVHIFSRACHNWNKQVLTIILESSWLCRYCYFLLV